jgi:LytS/YehU family sensor histidine kinase
MSALRAAREWMAGSTLAHVAFGFLAMGAWAVFANRNHPLPDALLAGLVQGTISGLLTLVLKKFLEWISARFAGLAALLLPPLVTASAIFVILVSGHTLAGTPEIAATIAVPFTVSTAYAILYNLRLWSEAHGRR